MAINHACRSMNFSYKDRIKMRQNAVISQKIETWNLNKIIFYVKDFENSV